MKITASSPLVAALTFKNGSSNNKAQKPQEMMTSQRAILPVRVMLKMAT